jgi:acyl-CoA reductase-like NAD-dependent aldehyde dehydrogenase
MTRPTVKIINIQTQEEVVREMNDEEYAHHLAIVKDAEDKQAEEEAKIAAKAAAKAEALAALGLSQEVINLLAE